MFAVIATAHQTLHRLAHHHRLHLLSNALFNLLVVLFTVYFVALCILFNGFNELFWHCYCYCYWYSQQQTWFCEDINITPICCAKHYSPLWIFDLQKYSHLWVEPSVCLIMCTAMNNVYWQFCLFSVSVLLDTRVRSNTYIQKGGFRGCRTPQLRRQLEFSTERLSDNAKTIKITQFTELLTVISP